MADGSSEHRTGPLQTNHLTFSVIGPSLGDIKKCSGQSFNSDRVNLSFYTEQKTNESCNKSETLGVANNHTEAVPTADPHKLSTSNSEDDDDRKKRCFDRYDSSESSDSGVAVLSPTESGGCSGSDITEPRSPRSPESACGTSEDSASTRMPPWANDPAPPGPRRLAVQPAPIRRPNPPVRRRITEYFNHKMKPQNGIKRDSSSTNHDDTKKKCLPKNSVTNDLEKYISYLSQTLSPKVFIDVEKQKDPSKHSVDQIASCSIDNFNFKDTIRTSCNNNVKGANEISRPKDNKETHTMNGFMEIRHANDPIHKVRLNGGYFNTVIDNNKQITTSKVIKDPSASMTINTIKPSTSTYKGKVPIPASCESGGSRINPTISFTKSPQKMNKRDMQRINGVVSSTTKLDSRMNGVTCGSNNLSLNPINKISPIKKEVPRKNLQSSKRTNRKSSACIANNKNLTWSKASNLKQVQHQKLNCSNTLPASTLKCIVTEATSTPNINLTNGMRQVSMAVNGNLSNVTVPVPNLPNCHQLNVTQQACNGTVTSTNLPSFVAVPQNVMLTTLRIPQNGLPTPTLNQPGGLGPSFNRSSMNVSSPTKLNGQIVFPFVQNLNGTVVQIPNMVAKVPSFVLPQSPQLTSQRQDHLQNQQAAQFLINGTLLKLAGTIPATYSNGNKSGPVTSQSIPMINKNVPGLQAVGMTVQSKPNFTVNFSHPLPHLMPQPGFIVTSVPNINVKETWSYTGTNAVTSSQSSCSNQLIHHPQPMVANFTAQTLHSSSIPIAPVKPPDNPIQGTDPPSSTVKEPEICDFVNQKCDIPWLTKTVNNNIVQLNNKISSRPFSQIRKFSDKLENMANKKCLNEELSNDVLMRDIECNDQLEIDDLERTQDTLFTQITVLKEVSSNVQSTVIEANYSSATTESSESGIGTDKSIDSPSDSQGSKECDEDSSLSLSISLSSVETQISQKSPILKQPKTLRFPPKSASKPESAKRTSSANVTIVVCLWENCKKVFDSDLDLLDHLQSVHVETQAGKENYVCLWERCKVRGKPSCSRLWLERHTLSHGGNKPFRCIVEGCDRRFSTQILLERHVNHHFTETSPNAGNGKKTSESSAKLIRRNGKKLRYRRQPWSARMFDFFDPGMMEGLAWRLLRSTRWRVGGACPLREPAGRHTLTLHAALAATRYNAAEARREALLTYYPPHVIEDEWVPEGEVKRIKRVEISQLPAHTKVVLYEQFCNSYKQPVSQPSARRSPAAAPQPVRMLPVRHCSSSRLLNNLLAKKRNEQRNECAETDLTMLYREQDQGDKVEVTGAKKRKMGRRYGGNSFWPCGR